MKSEEEIEIKGTKRNLTRRIRAAEPAEVAAVGFVSEAERFWSPPEISCFQRILWSRSLPSLAPLVDPRKEARKRAPTSSHFKASTPAGCWTPQVWERSSTRMGRIHRRQSANQSLFYLISPLIKPTSPRSSVFAQDALTHRILECLWLCSLIQEQQP